jgi:hypothetical protein
LASEQLKSYDSVSMPSAINTRKHKKWSQLFQYQFMQYNIWHNREIEMCLPANIHGVTFQKKPLYPKAFTEPDSVNFLGLANMSGGWMAST